MESSDSDSEESKIRRRVRRKSKSASTMALELTTPFSVLKERKSLVLSSTSTDEQSRRTNKLVKMLRASIDDTSGSEDAGKSLQVAICRPRSGKDDGDCRIERKTVIDGLKKDLVAKHSAWVVNTVDQQQLVREPETHWITEYMSGLSDVSLEKMRQGMINLPREIYMQGAYYIYNLASKTQHLSLIQMKTCMSLDKWVDSIRLGELRKIQLLRLRLAARDKLAQQPAVFDEDSIWGLKPLRNKLTAPYLKTSDGLCAAPPHPVLGKIRSNNIPIPSDFSGRQNWMAKDINALKDSIREALAEKRLLSISIKSGLLINDCISLRDSKDTDNMMRNAITGRVEEDNSEPVKKRGRPRKFGRQKVFATIAPTLFQTADGTVVRYQVNNADIQEWNDKTEDHVRQLKYNGLVSESQHQINWETVSNKVTLKTKKNRSAIDCYLAFKHEADPALNCKRWSADETAKLNAIVTEVGINDMAKIVPFVGNNRTEFQCFQRWKNNTGKVKLMSWGATKDAQLRELVHATQGNWKKVAFKYGDELATRNRVMDRFKKNSNPILKPKQFSRFEDALLLLTLEKLKAHLDREGHFGELIAYLPWRFETVWRDRAGNLFANFIVPWNLDEDKKLLELAETMKRDWRRISDTFQSFKNRKGCLTRWKILQKNLPAYKTLEGYHESYSMTRYNVFQYPHLPEILDLLTSVSKLPRIRYQKLRVDRTPTENELLELLMSYDKQIVTSAMASLEKYITERDLHWKDFLLKVKDKQKTFDRRTFHADIPQSMASALHIRGVKLVLKADLNFKLNQYQQDVYKFYGRFTRTKCLKEDADRPYIPTGFELTQLPDVQGIVQPVAFEENVARTRAGLRSSGSAKKPVASKPKARGRKRKAATPPVSSSSESDPEIITLDESDDE